MVRTGGMEFSGSLPSLFKALGLIPSTTNNNRNNITTVVINKK